MRTSSWFFCGQGSACGTRLEETAVLKKGSLKELGPRELLVTLEASMAKQANLAACLDRMLTARAASIDPRPHTRNTQESYLYMRDTPPFPLQQPKRKPKDKPQILPKGHRSSLVPCWQVFVGEGRWAASQKISVHQTPYPAFRPNIPTLRKT
eukprot:925385-Amphidinium_carterae.2